MVHVLTLRGYRVSGIGCRVSPVAQLSSRRRHYAFFQFDFMDGHLAGVRG